MPKKLPILCLILAALTLFNGCAEEPQQVEKRNYAPPPLRLEYSELSEEEIDYIERFNVISKNIRDFPRQRKNLEKYFHIFKNVADIKDARFILFGEQHTHSASQLWTAGTINMMIEEGDTILFEGAQANTAVPHIREYITTNIFAAREYELRKTNKEYKAISIAKMISKFDDLFRRTMNFLTLNILHLDKGRGKFWDLRRGNKLHPDDAMRNAQMVLTMKACDPNYKVFVIAGARHMPHYEFAAALNGMGKDRAKAYFSAPDGGLRLSNNFYQYFAHDREYGKTMRIYNFLKNQDYAVLIPKNLPHASYYEETGFFPSSY